MRTLDRLTSAFPAWVVLASTAALFVPDAFTWFRGSLITWGLGVIMLGMGLGLDVDDFRRVGRQPGLVAAGVALQYTIMPALGYGLGYAFGLPTPFAVGLVLVASCPGGTASNVITFLARGDVPLSVSMTAISTLLAAVATPALTALLAGNRVDVPAWGLLVSTVQVVVVPVLLGVALHRLAPAATRAILPVAPLLAVVTITLIVASIIGAGRDQVLESGFRLVGAVFCLHAGGFAAGYVLGRRLTRREVASRTIAIEVGMQNSGLGVVLARQHFPSPLVAIPCAISSVFHSVLGSLLAAWWRRHRAVS